MKGMKQLTAFLLVFVLTVIMAACAKSESKTNSSQPGNISEGMNGSLGEDTNAKGRYVETQIETPKGFAGKGRIQRLADGSLEIVDTENGTKSISTDEGKTWNIETIKELESLVESEAEISSISLAEDGGIFISYIIWKESKGEKLYPEQYMYLKSDHTIQEFELGIEEYKSSLEDSIFTTDGRLFVVTNSSNVYEIDLKKQTYEQIFSLEHQGDLALCTNEDSLIVQDGYEVYFYNLESKEVIAEDEVLNTYVKKQTEKKYGTVMCGAKNGKDKERLYLAGCEGVASHVIGGGVMEQLVDGASTNLGDPSKTPLAMLQNEDGSFLILYQDGELDSYVYDSEASVVPEQQITIYSLYDNETVRQAISVFRKKNTEVFVKFEIGINGENGVTESDAINNLNTELLAGEGPDLILLNGMPIESYEEKGMLIDLNDVIKDLEGANGYFDGILKAYQRENGTYVLPFRYEIPLLSGERSLLSNISDLETLADEAEKIAALPTTKETVLGSYTAEEVLEKLYLTSANVWITENGTVERDALKEFLQQAKRIYEAEQKNLDADERKEHENNVSDRMKYYGDEKAVIKVMLNISNALEELTGRQVLTAGYLSSMTDFEMLVAVKEKTGNNLYQIFNGQDSNIFCPTGIIGISSNSKNQETAKQFVEVLLGEEVQGKDLSDGFPVNADAYESFTKNPTPDYSYAVGTEDKEGNAIMLDYGWPEQEEIEQLKTIISTLETPSVTDDSLKDDIITIGAQALIGKKGVEDSVEEIIQKITLHLQE